MCYWVTGLEAWYVWNRHFTCWPENISAFSLIWTSYHKFYLTWRMLLWILNFWEMELSLPKLICAGWLKKGLSQIYHSITSLPLPKEDKHTDSLRSWSHVIILVNHCTYDTHRSKNPKITKYTWNLLLEMLMLLDTGFQECSKNHFEMKRLITIGMTMYKRL